MDEKVKNRYEAGLSSFNEKITELEILAKKAPTKIYDKVQEEIERLKIRVAELQNKVMHSTESGIESLASTFIKTMEDLNRGVENIKRKF